HIVAAVVGDHAVLPGSGERGRGAQDQRHSRARDDRQFPHLPFPPNSSSAGRFLAVRRRARHGNRGLEALAKFVTSGPGAEGSWGLGMTYCCGILVRDGLVMIADTRTNAGLDNVSTFRKLHILAKPGERIMAIASAGNLAISQSVLSTLTEGIEDPTTGEVETLMNAPTMFQAAQR